MTVRAFLSSVLAGVFISVGCMVYLGVGGVAGAALFAFGLLSVVHYGLNLYTGKAGFVKGFDFVRSLPLILVGNIVGCALCAIAFTYADPSVAEKCVSIVNSRNAHTPLQLAVLASGCGLIMTTAVKFAREGRYLPLLFGVPVFILCGFCHSIADAFYFCSSGMHDTHTIASYLSVVAGNFVGCNLPRLLVRD